MKKKLVSGVLKIVNIFYKGKKYSPGLSMANLGCGLRCLPGWANVDGSLTALFGSRRFTFINKVLYSLAGSSAHYSFKEYEKIIKECGLLFFDLRNGVPFAENSLKVIFTSHFLEHLSKTDGRNFLKECHRSLSPGGLLRIAVPDLDYAFKMYMDGRVEEMLDSIFYNSADYDFHAHKYNYSFLSLKSALEGFGFKNVVRCEYQKGNCPNIDYLDIYPEQSLYVECQK